MIILIIIIKNILPSSDFCFYYDNFTILDHCYKLNVGKDFRKLFFYCKNFFNRNMECLCDIPCQTNDGLYFPFSRFPIVSRRTPTFAAKSSCFISNLALYSLILFLIIGHTTPIFPIKISSNKTEDNYGKPKSQTNPFYKRDIRIMLYNCIIERDNGRYY